MLEFSPNQAFLRHSRGWTRQPVASREVVLAQLKLTDVSGRIRSVTEAFYQELSGQRDWRRQA